MTELLLNRAVIGARLLCVRIERTPLAVGHPRPSQRRSAHSLHDIAMTLVLIHERMLMQEGGGTVNHIFFDCGGGCALAFMQWEVLPGVPQDNDTAINQGLGCRHDGGRSA